MNTLTYVNASKKAFALALLVNRFLVNGVMVEKRYARYARQSKKFSEKVRNRLQEKEGN